ncbi:PIN domain-containing protein [Atopobiaceae bacterium 24-176]
MRPHPLVLFDTNVLLDLYGTPRPGREQAIALAEAADAAGALCATSCLSLKDFYYICTSCLKREAKGATGSLRDEEALAIRYQVGKVLDMMLDLVTPADVCGADVTMARKLHNLIPDFEDGLLVASAMRMKADLLVTSDQQLISRSPVATMAPKDATNLLLSLAP